MSPQKASAFLSRARSLPRGTHATTSAEPSWLASSPVEVCPQRSAAANAGALTLWTRASKSQRFFSNCSRRRTLSLSPEKCDLLPRVHGHARGLLWLAGMSRQQQKSGSRPSSSGSRGGQRPTSAASEHEQAGPDHDEAQPAEAGEDQGRQRQSLLSKTDDGGGGRGRSEGGRGGRRSSFQDRLSSSSRGGVESKARTQLGHKVVRFQNPVKDASTKNHCCRLL